MHEIDKLKLPHAIILLPIIQQFIKDLKVHSLYGMTEAGDGGSR
jgi:hypothetical protein